MQEVAYKFAGELQSALIDDDSEFGLEEDGQLTKVYNIEVDGWNTYFAGSQSLLVHNTVCVAEIATKVYGKLRGQLVLLEGFKNEVMTYIKRSAQDLAQLRRAFNSKERKAFLMAIGKDADKVSEMRKLGMTEDEIKIIQEGKVPKGYHVHHKKPLDDSGDNSFDNLLLIKNDPYHTSITNLQNELTKGMKAGDSKVVTWPTHDGFIYK